MRFAINCGISLIIGLILSLPAQGQERPVLKVGVVIDGPWELNDTISETFQAEITALLKSEFDVQFPEDRQITCDWSLAGVQKALDDLLADEEIDFVLAAGVIASNEVCHRVNLQKPVIAPFIIAPGIQDLPFKDGTSGVPNLNYLTAPDRINTDMEVFLDVVPFKKVVMLINETFSEVIPGLGNAMKDQLSTMNLEPTLITVGQHADDALNTIPDDAEAVYAAPLLQLPPAEFDKLAQGLIERGLPSFSILGEREVRKGLMAGTGSDDNFFRRARKVAIQAQRIFSGGENAGDLTIYVSEEDNLIINMATAKSIGYYPAWDIINEAELIGEEKKVGAKRKVSLSSAIEEALAVNLDLKSAFKSVTAGRYEVGLARSNLLPQIDLSATGVFIDQDRGSPIQPEKSLDGSAVFSQLVFSEPAWANLSIQKNLQTAREFAYEQAKLDLALEASLAYLNLMKAKTLERIQKDNLKVTRSNLELAKVREAVGFSGPGEVLRWKSQLASSRKNSIQANALRNIAEIQLNRVLFRPLEEPFETAEINLNDSVFVSLYTRYLTYINNPWSFKLFRKFMVAEGLFASPALKELDAAIEAKKQQLASSNRALFTPALGLQGAIGYRLWEDGAGSVDPSGVNAYDKTWSVGLDLSFPLFDGAAKYAEKSKASEELAQLQFQRQSIVEKIEQDIRSRLHLMGASFAGIKQARDAAEAADQNLEIVTDAYGRGAVSLIDLIDAQNAALVADQAAADAVFDFFIDLMNVERAIGRTSFRLSGQEHDELFGRLKSFLEANSE